MKTAASHELALLVCVTCRQHKTLYRRVGTYKTYQKHSVLLCRYSKTKQKSRYKTLKCITDSSSIENILENSESKKYMLRVSSSETTFDKPDTVPNAVRSHLGSANFNIP